jgi:myo-inositol-1-phosphate synthase
LPLNFGPPPSADTRAAARPMALPPRIGIWFIGARGGVATTATLGLLALQKKLAASVGLVSTLPQFAKLDLAAWESFVIGGHEIRDSSLQDSVDRLHRDTRVFDAGLIEACRSDLAAVDKRIRNGSVAGCGEAITELAGKASAITKSPWETIRRLQADLKDFQKSAGVERVVVVNLASTEPPFDSARVPLRWDKLTPLLENTATCPLSASSLYAIAALDLGMAYINFTPSTGASLPAISELAQLRKTGHAGQDGKTGETLLKSVLAPMFAARHLEIMSWVGHNIFGNMDGQILDNPANKAAKIEGKDQLVGRILGYDPQTLVSIEYIRSLGDWKTAWDHIHFRGFLNTPMTLQFTWQGCDSLLAAPLVLDLVRFVELSHRRGEIGILSHLGSFFKRPLGLDDHAFTSQFALLEQWAEHCTG